MQAFSNTIGVAYMKTFCFSEISHFEYLNLII